MISAFPVIHHTLMGEAASPDRAVRARRAGSFEVQLARRRLADQNPNS